MSVRLRQRLAGWLLSGKHTMLLAPLKKHDRHRCRSCLQDRIIGSPNDKDSVNEIHFIPNVDGGFTFPYCEECNEGLSAAEKKMLIWRLVSCTRFWPGEEEKDAIRRLQRGEMLCSQIDKGL